MLPSFRLIVAAFLCGFVVVFAGLRLAATLNHFHESMPVMAAHAASLPPDAHSIPPAQRASSPIRYELRLVASNAAIVPTLVPQPVSLTTDIALPPPYIAEPVTGIDAVMPEPAAVNPRDPTPAVASIDPEAAIRPTAEPPPEPEAQPDPSLLTSPPAAENTESENVPGRAAGEKPDPAPPAAEPDPPHAQPPTASTAPAADETPGPATTGPATSDAAAQPATDEAPAAASNEAAAASNEAAAAAAESAQPAVSETGAVRIAPPDPAEPTTDIAATPARADAPKPRAAAKAAARKRTPPAQRASQDPFGFPF